MLERKRKQSTVINKDDKTFVNQPMKKPCFELLNCLPLVSDSVSFSKSFPSLSTSDFKPAADLNNLRPYLQPTNMVIVSDEITRMEVTECDVQNHHDSHQRRPHCARCAAGEGGHISHIMR